MKKTLFLFSTLAALLAGCNGDLPLATEPASSPDQPVIATPVASELPPTEETPIMVEPPEMGAPKPLNSEYLPQREDGSLSRGDVFINHSELRIMESYPIQVALVMKGALPTPCNQLRVIAKPPNEQNQIMVEAYSVIDPELICIQVLEPLDVNIALGSFQTGHYSVLVNGEMVGEFDS